MESQQNLAMRHMRWPQDQWDFLGEVAKAAGLTRSQLVRQAALSHAAVLAARLPYSVSGTPQNTRPNQISKPIAKQGGSEVGGERSRTRSKPEAFSGINAEHLGREGGDFSPNEAKPKASKAKALRS